MVSQTQYTTDAAKSRAETKAVADYLDALEQAAQRKRVRSVDVIQERLRSNAEKIANASVTQRVDLAQKKIELEQELAAARHDFDISDVEERFIEAASSWSARKGISRAAWREVGVPAQVLKRAGV